ncbi:MAG: HAD family hydrolase [Phycisphaerae bacterium]|nr:HAD family hydrolase [Phycisphaerae bacterium]
MSGTARAIVFDLDDTLYLERDYVFSGFRAVAAALADDLGPADLIRERLVAEFDRGNRLTTFNALLEQLGRSGDATLLARMITCYREHGPTISLCEDADRALRRLAATARLGVLSDGRAAAQRAKVRALGLESRVHAIVLTDELGAAHWKPDTAAFVRMSHVLGAAPRDCTYVADNPAKDFVAPNRLGWRSIQIRRPGALYVDAPAPLDGRPESVICSLDELT